MKTTNEQLKIGGITLISLIVTIVILLILAGISISTLTNTGMFRKTKEAKEKTQSAEKEQNKILDEYETALDQYDRNTLVYKVNNGTIKIGDHIKYIPDTIKKDDEKYKTLISNLATYSGSSNNTESTLEQDELDWRILDVKDGHVRLISATPTTSTITLYGYNGYNNAVKLLDDTCSTLYTNSNYASKVQDLKIEDIQDKMKTDYTKIFTEYNKKFRPTNKYYPEIMLKEKEQKIISGDNTILGTELGKSEQTEFIKQAKAQKADTLEVTYNLWTKTMKESDFNDSKYYEIFIGKEEFYSTYWLSSRGILAEKEYAAFDGRFVENGKVAAYFLHGSYGDSRSYNYTFRPVITLKSNVQLDTTNAGDGSSAEHAHKIK